MKLTHRMIAEIQKMRDENITHIDISKKIEIDRRNVSRICRLLKLKQSQSIFDDIINKKLALRTAYNTYCQKNEKRIKITLELLNLLRKNIRKTIPEISELLNITPDVVQKLKRIIRNEKGNSYLINGLINGNISLTKAYNITCNQLVVNIKKGPRKGNIRQSNKKLVNDLITFVKDPLTNEMMSQEFKMAFDNFLDQIMLEASYGWKNTSKNSVRKYIEVVNNFIT